MGKQGSGILLLTLALLACMPHAARAQFGNGVYAVVVDEEGGFTVSGDGLHTWGFDADTLDAVGFLGGGFTVRYDREGRFVWKTGEGVNSMSGGMALLPEGGLVMVPRENNIFGSYHDVRRMDVVSLSGNVERQLLIGTHTQADVDANADRICSSWDRYAPTQQPVTRLVEMGLSTQRRWEVSLEHPAWLGSSPESPVAALSDGCALARVFHDSLRIAGAGWTASITDSTDSIRRWAVITTDAHGQLAQYRLLPSGMDFIYDLESDTDDNLYLAGRYEETGLSVHTTQGFVFLNDGHETNGFLAKLARDGSILWVRNLDERQNDNALGIALDGNGNVIAVGYANAPDDPWSGPATGVIKKYDNEGNLIWARDLTPTIDGTVLVRGVDAGPEGEVVVGGTLRNGATDVNSGLTIEGYWAFIARYDAIGQLNWARGARRVVDAEEEVSLPDGIIEDLPWPNPAGDHLFFTVGRLISTGGDVSIHDVAGRLRTQVVLPALAPGQQIMLDVRDLLPGLYTVTLRTGQGQDQRVFVKQ